MLIQNEVNEKRNIEKTAKHILNIGCGGRRKDKEYWYGDVRIDIQRFPNVTHVMDAHKLGFSDNTFEKVVAYEVLEHLESPIKALMEIRRVIKPDSEIEITVPNVWYWRLLLRAWLGQHFKRYRGLPHEPETDHKQMWDIYTFEVLADQVGLKIDSIDWLDWYEFRGQKRNFAFLENLRLLMPKHLRHTHVLFRLSK
jgi:predicted SAM-dependent methyltransferase